jgi:hypothetical protein
VRFAARLIIGPGLRPGPRRQARWVGGGLRRQGRALAPVALATRPEGAPLTLEGPTRTMRGVPAPVIATFRTATGTPGARRLPASSRSAVVAVRYGGVCAAAGCWGSGAMGSGPRRCAPALEARARLPRHLRREYPSPLAAPARHCPASFTLHRARSAHPPRVSSLGPGGLARPMPRR